MKEEGTFDQWGSFPDSLTQFSFYQKAIERSPEVFKKHPQFDELVDQLGLDLGSNLSIMLLNHLNPVLVLIISAPYFAAIKLFRQASSISLK